MKNSGPPESLLRSDAPDGFRTRLAETETTELLHACAGDYSGVARLGVEALCLKVKGVSIAEIAALYSVPSSHVGAWMSRAVQKLRRDEKFLAAFHRNAARKHP